MGILLRISKNFEARKGGDAHYPEGYGSVLGSR